MCNNLTILISLLPETTVNPFNILDFFSGLYSKGGMTRGAHPEGHDETTGAEKPRRNKTVSNDEMERCIL